MKKLPLGFFGPEEFKAGLKKLASLNYSKQLKEFEPVKIELLKNLEDYIPGNELTMTFMPNGNIYIGEGRQVAYGSSKDDRYLEEGVDFKFI